MKYLKICNTNSHCIWAIIFALLLSYASHAQFVTTWKTNNPGSSQDNQITIPGKGTYKIAWQEVGNAHNKGTTQGQNVTTVTFPKAGIYKVSMSGGYNKYSLMKNGQETT